MATHKYHWWWVSAGASLVLGAALMGFPAMSAQRSGPVMAAGGSALAALSQERLRLGVVREHASQRASDNVFAALRQASARVACGTEEQQLALAREEVLRGDRIRAIQALEAVLASPQACATSARLSAVQLAQARLHLGQLLLEQGEALQAADVLELMPAGTPIDDHVRLVRGRARLGAQRAPQAVEDFRAVMAIERTPLRLEATALHAHALVAAGRWSEGHQALVHVLAVLPDYPRRSRAMFELGLVLEEMQRPVEAAQAYRRAWLQYPYKEDGRLAREALEGLKRRGVELAPVDARILLERYRQLRTDKHWGVVEELLLELLSQNATPLGRSGFEHEIVMQLGLNAMGAEDFARGAHFLERLRSDWEAGHRDGIDARALYKQLSRCYTRLGRHDDALRALEKSQSGASTRDRLTAIAEFHAEIGQHDKARTIYAHLYTPDRQRGWHYSYLLFKSGRYQQAHANFSRMAERARGEGRAKYLYWAGRSLERAGLLGEAGQTFEDVKRAARNSYYAILATSRLQDIDQWQSGRQPAHPSTQGLVRAAEDVFEAMDESAVAMAGGAPMERRAAPIAPRVPGTTAISRTGAQGLSDSPVLKPHGAAARSRMRWTLPTELGAALTTSPAPAPAPARRGRRPAPPKETFDDADVRDSSAVAGQVKIASGASGIAWPRTPSAPRYHTQARIYWSGREASEVAFASHRQGAMLGPVPADFSAYGALDVQGALYRAVALGGDAFPGLVRAWWLREAGLYAEARREIRHVALEWRGLKSRPRPQATPHELPDRMWSYLVDNRRVERGVWGFESTELRFPTPPDATGRQALLARQQAVFDRRQELEPLLHEAFLETGEHHLMRRHALNQPGALSGEPGGPENLSWRMAYPRAFAEIVIPLARQYNVNPYLIWSLMLVESSLNPDSLSRAEAMGLLQVMPRTGYKIAEMFGDKAFGPQDLLQERPAITQGVFYFGQLLRKFHGQELFAFAGYNGGPHRVAGWLQQRGDMALDEFIEEIPFDESRNYAKKVLRVLNIYLRIYEGEQTLYVGQNVRADSLFHPEF